MPRYQFSVTCTPQYLPEQSDPARQEYRFAYTITIHNTGDIAAQLIARHWQITDANGQVQEVKGLGVVGQQPLLQPGEAFEYSSGCVLRCSSGSMHGHYFFVAEDAHGFDTPIAPFFLDALAEPGGNSGARVLH